jgi:copper chaperone CopZ
VEKTLKVSGMHCRSCEMLLSDSISEIKDVEKVSADFKKGTVTVTVKDERMFEDVKKAIEKEGYRVLS